MMVLRRKGGGLPANYQENYFWLNHTEAAVAEAEHAAEAGATEVPAASPDLETNAAKLTEPATTMPEAATEITVEAAKTEEAAESTVQPTTEPESAVKEETETAPEQESTPEEMKALPKRGGTMLGLDDDGEMPQEMTEEEAQKESETPKPKKRGFLGFGRRAKRR